MTTRGNRKTFRNEDLVLKVTTDIDPTVWDESKYEGFLDELCGTREYQKEAIRTTLRYLLGGRYANLRELARENFAGNDELQLRYGSWANMEKHLQSPDQLSCSIDLATAMGKSWVLYGIAAILPAEGAADRALVLCPSNTIEAGLTEKFRSLAGDAHLRDQLPKSAKVHAPKIINASETIVNESICVEDDHAILAHVKSSIRDSLEGKGQRVVILNDKAHHVANESASTAKKWKEFLLSPEYGFRMVVGVSGTCYVGDEYFADVVSRYSLRQAIEDRFVKKVEYVSEMPQTNNPDEKWQLIFKRHQEMIDEESKSEADPRAHTDYAAKFPIERCRKIVEDSLKRAKIQSGRVTEENRQRFLQALGTLRRRKARRVVYKMNPKALVTLSRIERQADSCSAAELRRGSKTVFTVPARREPSRMSKSNSLRRFRTRTEIFEQDANSCRIPMTSRHR